MIDFKLVRVIKKHVLFPVLLSWLLLPLPVFSESVHLQLRWHHQFQFAGYYAALEKGYYRKAGLDVIIHEGVPGKQPVKEVLEGRAQYGEANSELLLERLRGASLVALAAIYQHSASVLLTRKDARIYSPDDLVDKKVMMMGQAVDADFIAMFRNESIDLNRIDVIQSSYDIQDLISGKVDAFNAYISNEPYFMKLQGIDYSVINPRSYGVDFYSDILFTTEQEIKDHPERVKAFREASLEGWRYAMAHPQEIIDLLIEKYQVQKTREHLQFEAEAMKTLILPDLMEMGHMNPWRWRHMAETFVKAGMVDNDDFLQGFNYDPDPEAEKVLLLNYLRITATLAALASLIAVILFQAYRAVKRENRLRLKAEAEIRTLAFKDALTGLDNRHHFFILANQALKVAHRTRSKLAVLYIDLNDFKGINDCFGHKAGDEVLRFVGYALRNIVRQSDIAARLGGDEFSLVLNDISNDRDLSRLLQKLHQQLDHGIEYQGHRLHISVSIGEALYPDDGLDIDTLLEKADSHMYCVKFESKAEKNKTWQTQSAE